jgi:hypothetical protein
VVLRRYYLLLVLIPCPKQAAQYAAGWPGWAFPYYNDFPMHRTGVFISYRREDTAGYARVIYDRLTSRYPGQIFMDVTSIGAGADFVNAIGSAVGESRVLVALIGKQASADLIRFF